MISFASDNTSGVHPAILASLEKANIGWQPSYGEDSSTARMCASFQALFGADTQVFSAFTGTAANVLVLQSMAKSYEAIVCTDSAHIHTDECGALEAINGSKIYAVASESGKLTPDNVKHVLSVPASVHHCMPRVMVITQSTEIGTLYTAAEIHALADIAHSKGMYLFMDGARIANATAALGLSVREFTRDVGVDAMSFGGTKNGLLFGEAILFFRPELAENFSYICKQNMQLYSKARFLAAQFCAYLENDLWLENARHANAMAQYLAAGIAGCKNARISAAVSVNAVFVRLPRQLATEIAKKFYFYVWTEVAAAGYPEDWIAIRLMTSFTTQPAEIDAFIAALNA